jgi:hypothetical protein
MVSWNRRKKWPTGGPSPLLSPTWAEPPSGADGPQRRLSSDAPLRPCGPPLTGGVRCQSHTRERRVCHE